MLNESYAFQSDQEERENLIEEAIIDAGLPPIAKAPRLGTPAYERLMSAATGYMREVKKMAHATPTMTLDSYKSSDNYYQPKPEYKREPSGLSSEVIRRQYHNTLTMMLLNKERKGLSKKESDMISNFAAYVTGDVEFIDKW